jgi:hypothetical protein
VREGGGSGEWGVGSIEQLYLTITQICYNYLIKVLQHSAILVGGEWIWGMPKSVFL